MLSFIPVLKIISTAYTAKHDTRKWIISISVFYGEHRESLCELWGSMFCFDFFKTFRLTTGLFNHIFQQSKIIIFTGAVREIVHQSVKFNPGVPDNNARVGRCAEQSSPL